MHLDSLRVKVGDKVKRGDVIATVGSTGRSTGPHLDWRMFWRGARLDPGTIGRRQSRSVSFVGLIGLPINHGRFNGGEQRGFIFNL